MYERFPIRIIDQATGSAWSRTKRGFWDKYINVEAHEDSLERVEIKISQKFYRWFQFEKVSRVCTDKLLYDHDLQPYIGRVIHSISVDNGATFTNLDGVDSHIMRQMIYPATEDDNKKGNLNFCKDTVQRLCLQLNKPPEVVEKFLQTDPRQGLGRFLVCLKKFLQPQQGEKRAVNDCLQNIKTILGINYPESNAITRKKVQRPEKCILRFETDQKWQVVWVKDAYGGWYPWKRTIHNQWLSEPYILQIDGSYYCAGKYHHWNDHDNVMEEHKAEMSKKTYFFASVIVRQSFIL